MIQIQNLSIRQGKFALFGVSLAAPPGQYAVLTGKSGCGKTTILEAVAGLRAPHSGTITLAGRDVTRLRPAARQIGYVCKCGSRRDTLEDALNCADCSNVNRSSVPPSE